MFNLEDATKQIVELLAVEDSLDNVVRFLKGEPFLGGRSGNFIANNMEDCLVVLRRTEFRIETLQREITGLLEIKVRSTRKAICEAIQDYPVPGTPGYPQENGTYLKPGT